MDSDRVSPSEESGVELTGASLAPYSFEPSDSDSASASPDDDDDARDERLSDRETDLFRPCTCCYSQQRRSASPSLDMLAGVLHVVVVICTIVYLHAVYRERVPLVTSRSSPASCIIQYWYESRIFKASLKAASLQFGVTQLKQQ